jgi:signal transduction histidine kinase
VDKSRTKDTGGYGLGLSLCKTIMEAHGGKIEVQSTPQEGTTVSLYFPLTKT